MREWAGVCWLGRDVALANGGEGRGLSLANLEKEERGVANGVVGRLACGSKGCGGVSRLVTRQRELLRRG